MAEPAPVKSQIQITPETRLSHVLDTIPGALEYIVSLRPHDFQRLNNPLMRKYMSPRIKLVRVAAMAQVPVEEVVKTLVALGGDRVKAGLVQSAAPAPQTPAEPPAWMKDVDESTIHSVNVLPIDEVLGDPIPPINTAVRRMAPGSVLVIQHAWEPQPLYDLWTKMGIDWYTRQVGPDEWHVFVHKPETFRPADPNETVLVDLRNLPAEEGPRRAIAMFEQLPPGHGVEIWGAPGAFEPVRRRFEERHPDGFEWQEQSLSDDKQVVIVTVGHENRP